MLNEKSDRWCSAMLLSSSVLSESIVCVRWFLAVICLRLLLPNFVACSVALGFIVPVSSLSINKSLFGC